MYICIFPLLSFFYYRCEREIMKDQWKLWDVERWVMERWVTERWAMGDSVFQTSAVNVNNAFIIFHFPSFRSFFYFKLISDS